MNKEFDEIYRLYVGDVYRFLLKLSGDENLAEELTQETMFRAFRYIDSFDGSCKITVWLCQIGKNCFYDYCRKNKKEYFSEDTELIPDKNNMELNFEDKETARKIHRVIHDLEEPYKEVFTLRVFGELSYRDIADIFGKSENWARVIYYRAKLKILEKLH